MTKFCVILATQRSGTFGLGTGLEDYFNLKWLGEVFHSNNARSDVDIHERFDEKARYSTHPQLNFFNFRREILKKNIDLSYPSIENSREILTEYLKFVGGRVSSNCALLDIKYDCWHHLNSYWSMPPQRPGLVQLVWELELPVVHVIRENLFATYCSIAFAMESGVWHRIEDAKQPSGKVSINPQTCEFRMAAIEHNRDWFRGTFSGYERYFEVNYDELFDGNRLSAKVLDLFSEITDRKPNLIETIHARKTTPPLREVIENAAELLDHFKGGKYEPMVREALE